MAFGGEHHAILASFGRAVGRSPSFYGYAACALYLGPASGASSP
jgi:hypothetical protein